MNKINFDTWAQQIAEKVGFKLGEKIYSGNYYTADMQRNAVYLALYNNKKAVLKLYNDPRYTDEPRALKAFNAYNKSDLLKAPELYLSEMLSSQRGWLLMEQMPDDAEPFKIPLSKEKQKEFLDIFIEYKKHFPKKPTRKLSLSEQLPAHTYHTKRIMHWFDMANKKQWDVLSQNQEILLDADTFIPTYVAALEHINNYFKDRSLQWSHAHVKPQEIYYSAKQDIYYLLDFAHTQMVPAGYEYGFIVWADYFMCADWHTDYTEWKKGIDTWRDAILPIMREHGETDVEALFDASLIERLLGYILADITCSDSPMNEKRKRFDLAVTYLQELLEKG